MAKSVTEGPYKRGVKAQVNWLWEKLFHRAFQHLAGIAGFDCGTKRMYYYIDKKIASMVMCAMWLKVIS